jgi:putative transposase
MRSTLAASIHQAALRRRMALELLRHHVTRPWRLCDLRVLAAFRSEREQRALSPKSGLALYCQADRSPVADVARRHGISDQTIYAWRKRFGKLEAVDVRRLRQLEGENARLKKLVAERDLEIELMREVARKKW